MQFNVCSLTIFYIIKNPKLEDKKYENPLVFREKPSRLQPRRYLLHTDTSIFFCLSMDQKATMLTSLAVFPGLLKNAP